MFLSFFPTEQYLIFQKLAFTNLLMISIKKNFYNLYLSYDVASEIVIKSCIKNDNPLVD